MIIDNFIFNSLLKSIAKFCSKIYAMLIYILKNIPKKNFLIEIKGEKLWKNYLTNFT